MDQYLLLLARAVGRPNEDDDSKAYDVALPAKAWARVLGLGEEGAALRTVGRNWKTLEELDLVSLERRGRTIVATPKKEDGSGALYVHPAEEKEKYLQVPFKLWLDGYADELKTPAWAMLLIARSLKNWFPLPDARGPEWYGIGASTVERGFKQLRDLQLIERKYQFRPSFLEEQPWTKENRYRLRPPLDRPADQIAPGTTQGLKDEPPPKPAPPPTAERG